MPWTMTSVSRASLAIRSASVASPWMISASQRLPTRVETRDGVRATKRSRQPLAASSIATAPPKLPLPPRMRAVLSPWLDILVSPFPTLDLIIGYLPGTEKTSLPGKGWRRIKHGQPDGPVVKAEKTAIEDKTAIRGRRRT